MNHVGAIGFREATIGGMTFVANLLPPDSHMIRIGTANDDGYRQLIVVTVENGGRTLLLQGWTGALPSRSEWTAAKSFYFPAACVARWERRLPDGTFRHVRRRI